MLFLLQDMRPDCQYIAFVPYRSVACITLLQLAMVALIFGVTRSPDISAAFPVFIVMLVPLRRYALPKCFPKVLAQTHARAHECVRTTFFLAVAVGGASPVLVFVCWFATGSYRVHQLCLSPLYVIARALGSAVVL